MSGLAGISLGARLLGVRKALAKVPAWAWLAIAAALLAWWGVAHVRGLIGDADGAGYDRAMTEVMVKSERLKRQADELTATATTLQLQISNDERTRADEQARDIAADAAALRRMRPNAALRGGPACPATVPGAASRPEAVGGRADASVVAVDWQWLVDRAEQADLNRAETLTWRSWYERQRAAYDQWRAEWIKAGQGDPAR